MKLDDICSPGFVPNNHHLRKEVVRAISFAEVQGAESREEKARDLLVFFGDAIQRLKTMLPPEPVEELVEPEPEEVEPVVEPEPEIKDEPAKKPAGGKGTSKKV